MLLHNYMNHFKKSFTIFNVIKCKIPILNNNNYHLNIGNFLIKTNRLHVHHENRFCCDVIKRCISSSTQSQSSQSSPSSQSLPSSPLSSKQTFAERCVSTLPNACKPYAELMRLSRPTGTWLLLWPCFWSISMATPAGQLPCLTTMTLFGAGAMIMRGAGCVVNDIWDKDYDSKVSRTKSRPLANGQLSIRDAVMFVAGLLGCGLTILLQFDMNSIILGSSSLFLVIIYPLMKRITHWPQIVLGMAFNWGALLGWSVVSDGALNLAAVIPLYIAGICWTMVYDTIYAHQDIRDDLIVGVKSTAIRFGDNTRQWLSGFSIAMIANFLMCGIVTEQVWPYYTAIGVTAAHLTHQMFTLNINDPEDCGRKFRRNTHIGWIVFCGTVISTLLKNNHDKSENVQSKDIISQT